MAETVIQHNLGMVIMPTVYMPILLPDELPNRQAVIYVQFMSGRFIISLSYTTLIRLPVLSSCPAFSSWRRSRPTLESKCRKSYLIFLFIMLLSYHILFQCSQIQYITDVVAVFFKSYFSTDEKTSNVLPGVHVFVFFVWAFMLLF